jgi:hypothetical protein
VGAGTPRKQIAYCLPFAENPSRRKKRWGKEKVLLRSQAVMMSSVGCVTSPFHSLTGILSVKGLGFSSGYHMQRIEPQSIESAGKIAL